MDKCARTVQTFDTLAQRYEEQFAQLTLYDATYAAFCELLPAREDGARVLDAACGPGHVARYLLSRRPHLCVHGIDLAPNMVELARRAAPHATFAVHDCRELSALQQSFDGIIAAFLFPYL